MKKMMKKMAEAIARNWYEANELMTMTSSRVIL